MKYIDDFLVQVNMYRHVEVLPSDEAEFCSSHEMALLPDAKGTGRAEKGFCQFYEGHVPCPCWMHDPLVQLQGCLAWPDAPSRYLYYGNLSFQWLLNVGVSATDKARILESVHELSAGGAVSMLPYLMLSSACREDQELQDLLRECLHRCKSYCGCAR